MANLTSFPPVRQAWRCIPVILLPRSRSGGAVTFQPFSTSSHCLSSEDAAPRSAIPPEKSPPRGTPLVSYRPLMPRLSHLNESGDAHMVSISSKEVTKRTATAVCSLRFSNPLAATLIRENRVEKGDVFAVARVAGIMAAKRTADLIPLCHPIPISHVSVSLTLHHQHQDQHHNHHKAAPASSARPVGTPPHENSSTADSVRDSRAAPASGTEWADAVKRLAPRTDSGGGGAASGPGPGPGAAGFLSQQVGGGLERSWVSVEATVECDGKTGVEMEALTAASVAALTVYDMCKAVDKGMEIWSARVTHKEGGQSGTWNDGFPVP